LAAPQPVIVVLVLFFYTVVITSALVLGPKLSLLVLELSLECGNLIFKGFGAAIVVYEVPVGTEDSHDTFHLMLILLRVIQMVMASLAVLQLYATATNVP
jgi:hypothetical protein